MIEAERTQVLNMIEAGQISAEDGVRLLEADAPAVRMTELAGRWLHINVSDLHSRRSVVNVNLPLTWVALGLQLGGRFRPELQRVNLRELLEEIKQGAAGRLLDVEDAQEGTHIEIYVD